MPWARIFAVSAEALAQHPNWPFEKPSKLFPKPLSNFYPIAEYKIGREAAYPIFIDISKVPPRYRTTASSCVLLVYVSNEPRPPVSWPPEPSTLIADLNWYRIDKFLEKHEILKDKWYIVRKDSPSVIMLKNKTEDPHWQVI